MILGLDADNGEMLGNKPPVARVVDSTRKLAGDFPEHKFVLVGNETEIMHELRRIPGNVEIIHCPAKYNRQNPEKVEEGTSDHTLASKLDSEEINAAVSAGDSVQLASAFSRVLKRKRLCKPSFVVKMPSQKGWYILGDVGASGENFIYPNNPAEQGIQIIARDIYNQGLMSVAFARELGISRPRVGIACNGTEDYKGTDVIRKVVEIFEERLASTDLGTIIDFKGKAEPRDTKRNCTIDVLVAGGVLGNFSLKDFEEDARLIKYLAKQEIGKSPLLWLGIGFFYSLGRRLSRRLDQEENSGALLLGYDGILAIKDHGSATAKSLYASAKMAIDYSSRDFNDSIKLTLQKYGFVRGPKKPDK